MTPRDWLNELPPCATTGIGSLPMTSVDEAIAVSMQHDVPWLPELPRTPAEFMVPSALAEALPRAWEPFLAAVAARRPAVAKVQLAGPASLIPFGQTPDGRPFFEDPEALEQAVQRLEAKVVRMAGALEALGVCPLVFLDEPLIGRGAHAAALVERVRRAAAGAGAITGVHCCSQAPWPEVLGAGFDVVSFDVQLSLDAVLEDERAWRAFLARGGTACLGIIPTAPGATIDVPTLCDAVEVSLRATTPDFERALARMLLSPACGLALHTPEQAEAIHRSLQAAHSVLCERSRGP